MKLFTKQGMNLEALKFRKHRSEKDFQELMERIGEAASVGEFSMCFCKTQYNDYPCISAEQVDTLKSQGFKVHLWDGNSGWDRLHRFYKGTIRVTWR